MMPGLPAGFAAFTRFPSIQHGTCPSVNTVEDMNVQRLKETAIDSKAILVPSLSKKPVPWHHAEKGDI